MENLNKENFWNEMYSKYPNGTQQFCDWIDKYKKSVEWNMLFNERTIESPVNGFAPIKLTAPKFHDLPFGCR